MKPNSKVSLVLGLSFPFERGGVTIEGRMQGETVAHNICGQPTPYQRGEWFNSAKFFNLEYQT